MIVFSIEINRRFFLPIIFIFIVQSVFSQINIKVTSPENDEDDYHLVNNNDTAYILIEYKKNYNGLLQKVPWQLKLNNPDGEYKVYFDDSLKYSAYYMNTQKDSIWTYYDGKGEIIRKELYKKGKYQFSFENGNISFSDTSLKNSVVVINLFKADSVYFKSDKLAIFDAAYFTSLDENVAYLLFNGYPWTKYGLDKNTGRPRYMKQIVIDFMHNLNLKCDTVIQYSNGYEQIKLTENEERILVRTDNESSERLSDMYNNKSAKGFHILSKYQVAKSLSPDKVHR